MAAILNSAILESAILHKKNFTWFILTQFDDGSHLEFCHLELRHCHLGFSHLSYLSSQTHSHLPILVSPLWLWHKKNFTEPFWLNLMMAAILNSAMLDADTAILDAYTLLSSVGFTQKHSPSTLTLTQTNSNLTQTRWWQPSWILPSSIQPFRTKKLHLCILTGSLHELAANLNLAILDSTILVFPLKLTHTCQD